MCFAKPQVQYLGYIVSRDGITASPDKVKAVRQIPQILDSHTEHVVTVNNIHIYTNLHGRTTLPLQPWAIFTLTRIYGYT